MHVLAAGHVMSILLNFGVLMRAGGAGCLYQGQVVMPGSANLECGNGHNKSFRGSCSL